MPTRAHFSSPRRRVGLLIAFLVLFQGGIILGGLVRQITINNVPVMADFLLGTRFAIPASTTLSVVVSAVAALLLVRLCFRQPLWSKADWIPINRKEFGKYLLLGGVLQTLFVTVTHTERVSLVLHDLTSLRTAPNTAFVVFTAGLLMLEFIATGVEEVIWRGITLKALLQASGSPKLSVGTASVLFGVWHLFGSSSVGSVPYLTMIGLITSVVYFWSDSIYAAWGTHFGINIAAEVWTGDWSEAVTNTSPSDNIGLDLYLLGLLVLTLASWALNRRYKSQQQTQNIDG